MAKAELKTKKNNSSVKKFIDSIEEDTKRKDSREIAKMMRKASGKNAKMWGESIVGFGDYTYKYASGREGEWMRIGFSPRKQTMTIYIMDGFDRHKKLLSKLGKHKTSRGCLYFKRLSDIDVDVLNQLIVNSLSYMTKKYGDI